MDFILTKPRHMQRLNHYGARFAVDLDEITEGRCLITFGTGTIVPPDVLSRFDHAYNFHAASPAYPGRDPHHWAAYDGVRIYGATAHVMTEKVDDGPVVGTTSFGIFKGASPRHYAEAAEIAAYGLFSLLAHE